MRILHALGFDIEMYHLNEGHAALLPVALLREHPHPTNRPSDGALHYDANRVRERCVFTTHTPVEAGHDLFSYEDATRLLGDFLPLDQLKLLAGPDRLNMTRLALNRSEEHTSELQSLMRISYAVFCLTKKQNHKTA